MKIKLVVQTFTAFAFALGCTATTTQTGSAESANFFCGARKDTPATVARTSRGDIPVIRWVSTYFSGAGYTPSSRCVEVSKRFQTYYDNGTLNYITTGMINRQPVVCVAKSPGSGCSEVLFTLENTDDPNQVLQELLDVRVGTTAVPITRGETQVTQQPIYIDIKDYLSKTPVEAGITPISEVSPEKAPVRSGATPTLGESLDKVKSSTEAVTAIEQSWEKDYENYFKANLSDTSRGAPEIGETLAKLATETGKKPALIYAVPTPNKLELVLVLPGGKTIRKSIAEANRLALGNATKQFTQEITDLTKLNTTSYLAPAGQLYKWIIAPLDADLQNNKIDTIIFCMGGGLRSIPLAALHDGQKFLVEKYSIALIPAFNMTDTLYRDIKNSPVLAMGASEFKEQAPLAAVPVELAAIMEDLSGVLWPGSWQGKQFLNQEFTLDNLRAQRASQRFGIVHLATHAEFKSGAPGNSYIQFWDSKLTLDRMRQMQWNNPPVDLLVLSACRTAVGDKDAEMGFAGLAVNSGVKTVLASLWSVSDEGTLALMTEFYQHLRVVPIKAEALRQAQIGMLRGDVRLEGGQLRGPMLRGGMSLPAKLAAAQARDFKHPFYWAAFTMIGSPW
ncbi:CHAT domain-containing protein [Argonema galeatum]|uniref:CHAT domain-containing protein n=1 Tax=Argonema galeatum TaxID=2942762 RepID=UPI0020139D75|nr:CHAT domain-containing protein [Argonema galeatum]MCL1466022.1 CHAT domain-containing protein [Argonema galeatum A003/A1]